MAQIVLDRSGVPPIVGQLVAARMAQHMAADLEREARRLSSARNHALVTCHAQGCQTLGGEQVAPRLPLPLQAAKGTQFAPTNRVDAGRPARGAAHMQLPAEITRQRPRLGGLSKVQSVDQRSAWNAASAFANCGRAVAPVRGSYVP